MGIKDNIEKVKKAQEIEKQNLDTEKQNLALERRNLEKERKGLKVELGKGIDMLERDRKKFEAEMVEKRKKVEMEMRLGGNAKGKEDSRLCAQDEKRKFQQHISSLRKENERLRKVKMEEAEKYEKEVEEPPWKSQIRELKDYIVRLENDKKCLNDKIGELKN